MMYQVYSCMFVYVHVFLCAENTVLSCRKAVAFAVILSTQGNRHFPTLINVSGGLVAAAIDTLATYFVPLNTDLLSLVLRTCVLSQLSFDVHT